jgi:outer membrane protein assembly factor BamB
MFLKPPRRLFQLYGGSLIMAKYEYVQRGKLEEELAEEEPLVIEDEATKLLDSWEMGGSIWTRPAIYGDLVIFGSNDGFLYALDKNSGLEKWKFLTGGIVVSSPVVSDGVVYFGSFDKKFYALDARTGEKLWEFLTGGRIPGTAAVVDGRVYFGSEDGKLYCLTPDGRKEWEFRTGGLVMGTPTVLNGRIYVGSCDKHFYCIESGRKVWSFLTGGWVGDCTIADVRTGEMVAGYRVEQKGSSGYAGRNEDLRVCFGSYDQYFYCLDINGKELWKFQADAACGVMRAHPVKDQTIYFGAYQFFAVDLRNGSERWKFRADDRIGSFSALYHKSALFVGSYDGNIYALDAETGSKLFVFRTGGATFSPPIVDSNMLYFGSSDTYMYALDMNSGKTVWTFKTGMPPTQITWRGWLRGLNPVKRLLHWWKPELPKNRAYDKEERKVEWAAGMPSAYKTRDAYVMKDSQYAMGGQAYQAAKKKDDWRERR